VSLPAKNKLPLMRRLRLKHKKQHLDGCHAARKNARPHERLLEKRPQLAGAKWVGMPMSPCFIRLETLVRIIKQQNGFWNRLTAQHSNWSVQRLAGAGRHQRQRPHGWNQIRMDIPAATPKRLFPFTL
jgi:hypothetical protein